MNHDSHFKWILEVLGLWAATAWGVVTLQEVVLGLTAIYTILRIVVIYRDNFKRKGKKFRDDGLD